MILRELKWYNVEKIEHVQYKLLYSFSQYVAPTTVHSRCATLEIRDIRSISWGLMWNTDYGAFGRAQSTIDIIVCSTDTSFLMTIIDV